MHSYHHRLVNFPYSEGDREACHVFFVWELLRPLLGGMAGAGGGGVAVPLYVIPDDHIYDPPRCMSLQCRVPTFAFFLPVECLLAVVEYQMSGFSFFSYTVQQYLVHDMIREYHRRTYCRRLVSCVLKFGNILVLGIDAPLVCSVLPPAHPVPSTAALHRCPSCIPSVGRRECYC